MSSGKDEGGGMKAAARGSFGCLCIMKERTRQVLREGWSAEHDDAHVCGELVCAAGCYLRHAAYQAVGFPCGVDQGLPPDGWPWDESWWKPSSDPVRNLEKAGALIAAEIDRYARAGAAGETRDVSRVGGPDE